MRASLCARSGRAAEALETLHAQLTNPHLVPWSVFNAACGYALASTAAELPEEARAAAADAAVAALRRALAMAPLLRDSIDNDHDLDSLRHRPDFQALLAGK